MKIHDHCKVMSLLLLSTLISGCPFFGGRSQLTADSAVHLAWESAPRTIDSRYAQDATSQYLEDLVHCSLINFGESGEVVKELAKTWEWIDNKTLEVSIRNDIKFSNSSPVRAEDVVATYRFFLQEATPPSPRAGAFRDLLQVATKGSDRVVFKLREPDASFVTNLVVGILPASDTSKTLIDQPQDVVGCGPFRIEQQLIDRLVLARNDHYNLGPLPKLENVVIEYVRDEQTRFAKLVKGELDLVQNMISRDKLPEIARRYPKLNIIRRPGLSTTYLGFNMDDALTGRKEIRQAIAHAIDRDVIIKHILHGLAIPAKTLITPDDLHIANDLQTYSYDPERSNAILDAAGFVRNEDGFRFNLTYKTTTDITRVSIARAIASQLRQVGINVTVQPQEWGRFRSDVDQGLVQMWSLSWIGFKDPDIFRFAFASENIPPNGPNRGRFRNDQLDRILQEASKATDQAQRIKLYNEAQHIVNEQLPYVFLWHEEVFAVVQDRLEDFTVYADGRLSSLTDVSKR